MTDRVPGSVVAARVVAGVQVVAAAAALVFGIVVAIGGAGQGSDATFSDLATAAGLAIVAFGLVPLLVLGVPLLLMRRGRDGARVALVLGEVLIGLLSFAGFAFAALYAVALIAVCAVVVVLLVGRPARRWSQPSLS